MSRVWYLKAAFTVICRWRGKFGGEVHSWNINELTAVVLRKNHKDTNYYSTQNISSVCKPVCRPESIFHSNTHSCPHFSWYMQANPFRQVVILLIKILKIKPEITKIFSKNRGRKYNSKSKSQGLSLKQVKFILLGRSPLAVTPHFGAKLAELQFLRMKGKGKPKPNSTRVCLSAIVDIFICRASKAETQWEIRTSQPKLTVRSQTVKRSAPSTTATTPAPLLQHPNGLSYQI